MDKRRASLGLFLFLGINAFGGGGCTRQDTESLSNIGRKIMERASAATAPYRQKLVDFKSANASLDSIQDRVTCRLRWEKVLADTPIEVVASGAEIELKGTVKSLEQRTRAVEIAESTMGVERVLNSLTVSEEKKEE